MNGIGTKISGFDATQWLRRGALATAVAAVTALSAPAAKADALASAISLNGQLDDWGLNVQNGGNTVRGGTTYPCGATDCDSVTGITVPQPPLYQPGTNANPTGAGGTTNHTSYTTTNEITTTTTNPQIVTPVTGALNPFIEDSNDTAGSGGTVGPEAGGQNYDAEFLGAAVQQHGPGGLNDATLYLGILSGLRPDSGHSEFGPGDIFITTHNADGSVKNAYGIEVGGGDGCSSANCSNAAGQGTTYQLNSNGYTLAANDSSTIKAGDLFLITDASSQTIATPGYLGSGNTYPVQLKDSALDNSTVGMNGYLGNINFSANWNPTTCVQASGGSDQDCNQHSILEGALDTSLFAGDAYTDNGEQHLQFSVYWGPSCGNDVVATQFDIGWQETPEPGTLAIFGFGLLGLGFPMVRARKRKGAGAAAA